MAEFEFIRPEDKPALLAMCNEEWTASVKAVVDELGYKSLEAANEADFLTRFSSIQFQLVIIDELFCAATPAENTTLQSLQVMPMSVRRHATIILIGDSFQTMHPLQAFQQSVHAVVNRADAATLAQIIQPVIADNSLFLHTFRDTQRRIAEGKA
jgi:2-polyprenyl-6-methoxyphenol hydroxylase-like FAD-dependent oxidoreductase